MYIQGRVPAGLQCDSHEEKGKQTDLRGHEAMEGCETVEISGVEGWGGGIVPLGRTLCPLSHNVTQCCVMRPKPLPRN